jgi:hypothetical protein
MKMSDAFPSDYLKASDLRNKSWDMTIDRVEMVTFQSGEAKPCLYIKGAKKGLLLNKTNATILSGVYGDETEDWKGKKVKLYPVKQPFQGRTYDVIRVDVIEETIDEDPPDFLRDMPDGDTMPDGGMQ